MEIRGSFNTTVLSPSTMYNLMFVVRRKVTSFPLRFEITLPSGKEINCDRQTSRDELDKWIEIVACDFSMSQENVGELSFVLKEERGETAGGLEILGVCLLPKDNVRALTSDLYTYYLGSDDGIFADEPLSLYDRLRMCFYI